MKKEKMYLGDAHEVEYPPEDSDEESGLWKQFGDPLWKRGGA